MSIAEILTQFDYLLEANRANEAEQFVLEQLEIAKQEKDFGLELQLLNELIGFYRATSNRPRIVEVANQAIELAHFMEITQTVAYATTLLNVANAYRSIGELEQSLTFYQKVSQIYDILVGPDDMLKAGLYNNMSLLYQELKDYDKAKQYLLQALQIAQSNKAQFEIAVTYANLANTCVLIARYAEAKEYAGQSIKQFDAMNYHDAHYASAISALGICYMEEQEFVKARELFVEGMRIIEQSLGKNSQYQRLEEQLEVCEANIQIMSRCSNNNSGRENRKE